MGRGGAMETTTATSAKGASIDIWKLVLFPVKTTGHLCCVAILLTGAFWMWLIDSATRFAVHIIATCTVATCEVDTKVIHEPRAKNDDLVFVEGTDIIGGFPGQGNQIIDEEATLALVRKKASNKKKGGKGGGQPPSENEMMDKVRLLLRTEFGAKQPDLLADDFQFLFPVVGPLSKAEFVTAFSSFKVFEAFPEGCGRYFGFTRDPIEPNRVWFFSRDRLVHQGTLNFGAQAFPATGKEVLTVPQVLSVSFDGEFLAAVCWFVRSGAGSFAAPCSDLSPVAVQLTNKWHAYVANRPTCILPSFLRQIMASSTNSRADIRWTARRATRTDSVVSSASSMPSAASCPFRKAGPGSRRCSGRR